METKMTKRGPAGRPEEVERRKRKRGLVGTIRKDNRSTSSKALDDAIVQEHGSTSEEVVDDMVLPGIFNHIIMAHIVPKLCWKETLLLAPVSRTWRHVISSREVHDARVSYQCADTFIVLPYNRPQSAAESFERFPTISIALYSMKEDRCYELPPLPPLPTSLPGSYWHTSVSLDGKVYVMQDYASCRDMSKISATRRMLTFDVAGQGGWQPCANQQILRIITSTCGVLNGKIYAFDWGEGRNGFKRMSEVYNPIDNTWIEYVNNMGQSDHTEQSDHMNYVALSDIINFRADYDHMCVLGDKLVMRRALEKGSKYVDLHVYDSTANKWTGLKLSLLVADGLDLNRKLQNFEMFTTQGNLYAMDQRNLHIYDSEKGLWKCLHTSSFTGIGMGPVNSFTVFPKQVLVVDEELVAIVVVYQTGNEHRIETLVLRSKSDLGGENMEIVWQKSRARTDVVDRLTSLASAIRI